jgi:hypothetical protein
MWLSYGIRCNFYFRGRDRTQNRTDTKIYNWDEFATHFTLEGSRIQSQNRPYFKFKKKTYQYENRPTEYGSITKFQKLGCIEFISDSEHFPTRRDSSVV